MMNPVQLPDKLPGEEVIKVVRRDAIFVMQKIAVFAVLLVALAAGRIFVGLNFPDLIEGEFAPILMLGGYALLMFVWLFLFFSLVDYLLDVWFITNQRIIDIRQDGLFSRKVSEQYLHRVQDVTSNVVGVMPTIFKYGNVHVQTAAEKVEFLFEQVPDPDGVRRLIMELSQKSHEQHDKLEAK